MGSEGQGWRGGRGRKRRGPRRRRKNARKRSKRRRHNNRAQRNGVHLSDQACELDYSEQTRGRASKSIQQAKNCHTRSSIAPNPSFSIGHMHNEERKPRRLWKTGNHVEHALYVRMFPASGTRAACEGFAARYMHAAAEQ
jgi:hypothetical protein